MPYDRAMKVQSRALSSVAFLFASLAACSTSPHEGASIGPGSGGTGAPDGATGSIGDGGPESTPPIGPGASPSKYACPETTVPVVAKGKNVVGTGSAASCDERALKTAFLKGGDITFDCGGPVTIALTSKAVISVTDTAIDGAGQVTLDGQGQTQVLTVNDGLAYTIENLTIANGSTGNVPDGQGAGVHSGYNSVGLIAGVTFKNNVTLSGVDNNGGGGGLYTHGGTVRVVRSSFLANKAGNGGAIATILGNLTIIGSQFEGNAATVNPDNAAAAGGGGAIAVDLTNDPGHKGVFCGDVFRRNTGQIQGGALSLYGAGRGDLVTFRIDQSTFESNTITAKGKNENLAHGGGIFLGQGNAEIANSTFSKNSATGQGGGLFASTDQFNVTMRNVTFVENKASLGGAIMRTHGTMSLTNLTLTDNHAESEGGAIAGADAQINLQNSIVFNNTGGNPYGNKQNCSKGGDLGNNPPPSLSGSHNLEFPAPKSTYNDPLCTGSPIASDPMLSPLADNGGPVLTRAIHVSGPAVARGNSATCPEADARARTRAKPCDLGAFEHP